MATILTNAIIDQAVQAVDAYSSAAKALFEQVQSEVNSISSDFMGDAADGYREFFLNKVQPALDDNLVQLMNSIKQILENIRTQLMATVDPQLGTSNRSGGSGGSSGGISSGSGTGSGDLSG